MASWEKVQEQLNTIKNINQERGAIFVLTALLLPVLFGFVGFGFDIGNIYMHKARLQNVADAAALAGARAYVNSQFKTGPNVKIDSVDTLTGDDNDAAGRAEQIYRYEDITSNNTTKESRNDSKHPDADNAADEYIYKNIVNLGDTVYSDKYSHYALKDIATQTKTFYRVGLYEEVPLYFLPIIMNKKSQTVRAGAVALVEPGKIIPGSETTQKGLSLFDKLFTVERKLVASRNVISNPDANATATNSTIKTTFDGDIIYTGSTWSYSNALVVQDHAEGTLLYSKEEQDYQKDKTLSIHKLNEIPNTGTRTVWDTSIDIDYYVAGFLKKLEKPHYDWIEYYSIPNNINPDSFSTSKISVANNAGNNSYDYNTDGKKDIYYIAYSGEGSTTGKKYYYPVYRWSDQQTIKDINILYSEGHQTNPSDMYVKASDTEAFKVNKNNSYFQFTVYNDPTDPNKGQYQSPRCYAYFNVENNVKIWIGVADDGVNYYVQDINDQNRYYKITENLTRNDINSSHTAFSYMLANGQSGSFTVERLNWTKVPDNEYAVVYHYARSEDGRGVTINIDGGLDNKYPDNPNYNPEDDPVYIIVTKGNPTEVKVTVKNDRPVILCNLTHNDINAFNISPGVTFKGIIYSPYSKVNNVHSGTDQEGSTSNNAGKFIGNIIAKEIDIQDAGTSWKQQNFVVNDGDLNTVPDTASAAEKARKQQAISYAMSHTSLSSVGVTEETWNNKTWLDDKTASELTAVQEAWNTARLALWQEKGLEMPDWPWNTGGKTTDKERPHYSSETGSSSSTEDQIVDGSTRIINFRTEFREDDPSGVVDPFIFKSLGAYEDVKAY